MAVREHGLFRRVDHPGPDVAKGGCYFSYDTGPGVDTGILIEFEGTLFFSLNTVKELAEVAGFAVDEEAVEHELRIAELEREVERLTAVNAEQEQALLGFAVAQARGVQAMQAAASVVSENTTAAPPGNVGETPKSKRTTAAK